MKKKSAPLFPIVLRLQAKRCVVVGAGKIAAAKVAGLLRSRARLVVIAPHATPGIQRHARAKKLKWLRREFRARDVAGAFLVIAATDCSVTNEAVFRACTAQGVLCNVVDDPEHCDFFYPAVVRRGPLQIAISTEGRSPALAHRLRIELERQFGPEYGAWIEHVGKMRKKILTDKQSAAKRRQLLEEIASYESYEQFLRRRRSPRTPNT